MSYRRHLVRWEAEYACMGLEVIEISGGTNASLEQSRRLFTTARLNHPVLWDHESGNQTKYGVTSWPQAVIVDAQGVIVWRGNPAHLEGRRDEMERFRNLLVTELNKVSGPKSTVPTGCDCPSPRGPK